MRVEGLHAGRLATLAQHEVHGLVGEPARGQPLSLTDPMAAVGWNGELAGTWGYFARREASRAMKANANATASRTMVERMSISTAPPAHQFATLRANGRC
jgi:hypothetical protein